jgi:type IX secretion system substrate protein/beta-propeller repeat-containing protein
MRIIQLFGRSLLLAYCSLISMSGVTQVNEEWVARYNGPGNASDVGIDVEVDDEGNVYVTGSSTGVGTFLDYATIKYNSAGVQQWVARYNGPANGTDRGQALTIDDDGNVYVTGHSLGIGTDFDYATIKYNSAGSELWVARFNGEGDGMDIANSIAVDNSGNVYVTGNIVSGFIPEDPFPIELQDWGTVEYNASGVEQWVAIHDEGGDDFAESVVVDNLGNVFVTGSISNSPPGLEEPDLDYGTIKYNASTGAEIWVAKYGPPPGEDFNEWRAADQALDSAGNVYVTGQTGQGEYGTIKWNTNGELQWAIIYTNGVGDAANAIAVDASGNVYVTGGSQGIGTGTDYATIKYSQQIITACGKKGDKVLVCHKGKKTLCISKSDTAGHLRHGDQLGECVEPNTTGRIATDGSQLSELRNVPANFRVTVAPNPTAVTTKIFYELPADSRVSIKIYDMLGREITTLVDAGKQAGFHSTDLHVAALQKGMYYYRITVKTAKNLWVQTGKISVIK